MYLGQEEADVQEVVIPVGRSVLHGILHTPAQPQGAVVFALGSWSSCLSEQNRSVARVLHDGGLATLLVDLLTPEEVRVDAQTRHLRFDVPLLAGRLVGATDWMGEHEVLRTPRVGYYGASSGVAAAMIAAARRPNRVGAIVSRGGRPDMARAVLTQLRAPTLLIVGEHDTPGLATNQEAMAGMVHAKVRLVTVPGATHLFQERWALPAVAELARTWFLRHLPPPEQSLKPPGEVRF